MLSNFTLKRHSSSMTFHWQMWQRNDKHLESRLFEYGNTASLTLARLLWAPWFEFLDVYSLSWTLTRQLSFPRAPLLHTVLPGARPIVPWHNTHWDVVLNELTRLNSPVWNITQAPRPMHSCPQRTSPSHTINSLGPRSLTRSPGPELYSTKQAPSQAL